MSSKQRESPPVKKKFSTEDAVTFMLETDEELSDFTENDFSDSGSDVIESESEESVVLSDIEPQQDIQLVEQDFPPDINDFQDIAK